MNPADFIVGVLSGGVRGGTPILYAALGETVTERSGIINLGTEGSMLVGALTAYAVAAETGDAWLGVLAGGVAGAILSAIFAMLVVWRGANQFATGLTMLFLALGLTSLFGAAYVSRTITPLEKVKIPGLGDIPWIGEIFFDQDPLVYISYVMVPVIWFLLFRTRFGLLVRTAGGRSDALVAHGYDVGAIRIAATTIGGFLAGVGGAHLSVAYTNTWFENMVAGRGFIAVALVIFAAWGPVKVMGGAYLFGAALALSPVLQANGVTINQFALDVIPFVLTLVVLAALGRRTVSAAPAELQRVFENGPPTS